MFYTIADLKHLFNSPEWSVDGTFKDAPLHFYQIWTIHGKVFNHVFPFVYCLSTGKTEEVYTFILNHLKTHAVSLGVNSSPTRVISDFEIAVINSVHVVFPQALIGGCLFHYTQSIYRRAVTECRLKRLYHEDPSVKVAVNHLLALPFIPLTDVIDVFDDLISNEDIQGDLLELYLYVERVYIRGVRAQGRRRAVPPRFRPDYWNHFISL